tara:strand:- start:7032 stop:7220 length:189 start_codon:yes stop_codon:yes gene_type:complete
VKFTIAAVLITSKKLEVSASAYPAGAEQSWPGDFGGEYTHPDCSARLLAATMRFMFMLNAAA